MLFAGIGTVELGGWAMGGGSAGCAAALILACSALGGAGMLFAGIGTVELSGWAMGGGSAGCALAMCGVALAGANSNQGFRHGAPAMWAGCDSG